MDKVTMKRKQEFRSWIKKNYPDKLSQINKCAVAVNNMTLCFFDLEVQVGTANGRYHCWTIDKDGEIFDPTADQFKLPIKYRLIANRFLEKDEIELSTGAIFFNQLDSHFQISCSNISNN